MPIGTAELVDIETVLHEAAGSAQAIADLRHRFAALSVTQCDASDVDLETPVRVLPRFSLYLVDGTDHCWRLTTDTARATGLVVVAT